MKTRSLQHTLAAGLLLMAACSLTAPKFEVDLGDPQFEGPGSLAPVLEAVQLQGLGKVRACYQRLLMKDKHVAGSVRVRTQITAGEFHVTTLSSEGPSTLDACAEALGKTRMIPRPETVIAVANTDMVATHTIHFRVVE